MLIHYDSATGKFQVGAEALAVLKALKGPVSIVAVCGRARQVGSSYTWLLGYLMWPEPGPARHMSVRRTACTHSLPWCL